MPELPRISGDEAIKVFKKLGFYEARLKANPPLPKVSVPTPSSEPQIPGIGLRTTEPGPWISDIKLWPHGP